MKKYYTILQVVRMLKLKTNPVIVATVGVAMINAWKEANQGEAVKREQVEIHKGKTHKFMVCAYPSWFIRLMFADRMTAVLTGRNFLTLKQEMNVTRDAQIGRIIKAQVDKAEKNIGEYRREPVRVAILAAIQERVNETFKRKRKRKTIS